MAKTKSSLKLTSLFDIRLKNLEHDVLVLKGNENDAGSSFLNGNILLSVTEPINIKKISLRLYGTIRLKYGDINPIKGGAPKPSRFEKKIYEHQWDSNEISKYMNNMYENSVGASGTTSPPHEGSRLPLAMAKSSSMKGSTTSLKNLGLSFRSKSSTSLSQHGSSTNLAHSSSTSSLNPKNGHVLVLGNYEFPFSAILPGNMPESVEGLPGASVVYKIEATIDRGKFHNTMVTKRHVRVVRTLTTDSVELSETVAVDNTWPKKVEYSLSVPSKAIAIGSGVPISFMLVPLLKGLRLGNIKIQLVELYSFVGYIPPAHTSERIVVEKSLPAPKEDDPHYQIDRWEVTSFLKVPPSLSKCTQDCDILTHIKVRHKLKFVIGLVNPDGHTSELRASLPVQLFISPFVTVRARADDEDIDSASVDRDIHGDEEEEVLFEADPSNLAATGMSHAESQESGVLHSNNHSYSSFTGLVAPPVYEQHVYDQLWSDVTPIDSPSTSGSATPRSIASGRGNDVLQFSMSSIDTAKLTENLRQLSIQRQLQENLESGRNSSAASVLRDRAVFNLNGDEAEGDYFSKGRPVPNRQGTLTPGGSHMAYIPATPGIMSPPLHLSRAGSETDLTQTDMSRVPSYNEAMKSSVDETLSPTYIPPQPGSGINIEEVNRRFEEHASRSPPANNLSRNRLFLSRGSSSFNLKNMSRSSSNNSSPSNSRSVSGNNLSSLSGENGGLSSKRSTTRTTGSATFSMTPM
ncbi:CIC11C00000000249 [Sungouiella intermedia]|uniref:CIC11C00000000249 n=1 Tax=Sungouiella intermedia TaxID=45354 RepID=A0A1L0DL55_9ASCO|nr:CIC11C00000000249 [[Candida] intermedia]